MNTAIVRYVGLDVHKRVVEACVVDTQGQVLFRDRFALNRGSSTPSKRRSSWWTPRSPAAATRARR